MGTRTSRLALAVLCACMALLSQQSTAFAFKVKMHIRTANVAMYDAMDGAICMPGLTGPSANDGELPPQIPLGNTPLQHFYSEYDEEGRIKTSYRSWLLQYAPYVRAGAVGPDGFPDMLIGQLFVHGNHSTPYDCETVKDGECLDIYGQHPLPGLFDGVFEFGNAALEALMQFAPPLGGGSSGESKLGLIKKTFGGQPHWRSVDWGHEVLYRALHYHDEILLDENGFPNQTLSARQRAYYLEEKRAAVAFAMGYFMHMVGDGQAHSLVNQLVAMPWSYFDTRTPNHPSYGWLSMMQEELQHMALERYISGLYAPGTEPQETMRHVDGLACEPFVPKDNVELQCMPDKELRPIQVEDCRQCNPLRSADPSEVDSRCDHCFTRCNPWKEICPPDLPGGGFICPESEVCPNIKPDVEQCKSQFGEKPDEMNTCIRDKVKACTTAKESCACNRSVKVLKDMGILIESQVDGTCLSQDAKSLVQSATEYLSDAQNLAQTYLGNSDIEQSVKDALNRDFTQWQCNTQPLDMRRVLTAGLIPDEPRQIPITDDEGNVIEADATFEPHGYVLDLNENGKADLLNECILINCRINPHGCPYNALDWELPNSQVTDVIPCKTIPNEEGFESLRYDDNGCDSGLFGSTAIDVDVKKLLAADRDDPIVEHFLNSNYMSVPKKFVADVFYMDRRYHELPARPNHTDPSKTAAPRQPQDFAMTLEPGSFGTYSLGGYPVNAVHSMIDLLRLMGFYTQVSITDVIAIARQADPNNIVFGFLDQVPKLINGGVSYLRLIAKRLHESRLLNFEFKIPFTEKVVRIDLGKRLAVATLIIADELERILPNLKDGADRIIANATQGLNRRIHRLEDHIMHEWPDVTTCLAEFANSGEGRFYAIDRVQQFMSDAFAIMITGAAACEQPPLVASILSGNLPNNFWDSKTVDEMMQATLWATCQLESIILQRFYLGVLLPAFNKLYEETAKRYICPIIGIKGEDSKDNLTQFIYKYAGNDSMLLKQLQGALNQAPNDQASIDRLCFDIVDVVFNPTRLLNPINENILSSPAGSHMLSDDPPISTRDFYRNIRMISAGACWNGGSNSEHISDRDRVRVAYSDFELTTMDGQDPICSEHKTFFDQLSLSSQGKTPTYLDTSNTALVDDPIWSEIRKARTGEYKLVRNPSKPAEREYSGLFDERSSITVLDPEGERKTIAPYRAFMLPNKYDPNDTSKIPHIYEHPWEFDSRPGPPLIKTLDRAMNAPDPYSEPRHTQRFYNPESQQFETRKVHLMNSVGFATVYNTMQLNKLSFMGPGSPGVERCVIDEAKCNKDYPNDSARCQILAQECNPGATGAKIDNGMGVHSLIVFGNKLTPEQLGSGQHGYRDPRDLFHDTTPLVASGNKDTVLGEFFQEQYLSKHQNDVSHPGQRSCKSLNYHPLCNSIYDLDDPDQYCRQTHAWAYFNMQDIPTLDPMMNRDRFQSAYEVSWPEPTRRVYEDELNSLGLNEPYAAFWPRRTHDACAWLYNVDGVQTRAYLNKLGNGNAEANTPYVPDNTRAHLITKLRGRDQTQEMQVFWDGNEAWAHGEHARDYAPTTRSFILESTRRHLDPTVKPSITPNGEFLPSDSELSYTPTRFALANKDSHVARLYSKVMAPHYCPLSPDQADTDCDGIPDLCDNCPLIYNPQQQNSTNRGSWSHLGDACREQDPQVQDLRCKAPEPPKSEGNANGGICNCGAVHTPPRRFPGAILLLLGLTYWRRRTKAARRTQHA